MNIADYLTRKGIELEPVGDGRFRARCLFHSERRPSMYVYTCSPEHFYCYGCNAHGDLGTLIKHLEFEDRSDDAVWREVYEFAERRDIPLKSARQPVVPASREVVISSQEILALTIATEVYHEDLRESPKAVGYLLRRGVRHPLALPLGYVSGRGFHQLTERLKEALREKWRSVAQTSGLLWPDGAERLRHRIFIPETRQGQTVYFQARTIKSQDPLRYLNPKRIRKTLIGLDSLGLDPRIAVLVEGPFDALPLISVGMPAVALLGNRSGDDTGLVRALGNRHVVILTDNDTTGHQIATQMTKLFDAARIKHSRLVPAVGKDVGEWCEKLGPEWVAASIHAASSSMKRINTPVRYAA